MTTTTVVYDGPRPVKEWFRLGSVTWFRGQTIPAKYHRTERVALALAWSKCGRKFELFFGFDTRATPPPVKDRCARCVGQKT